MLNSRNEVVPRETLGRGKISSQILVATSSMAVFKGRYVLTPLQHFIHNTMQISNIDCQTACEKFFIRVIFQFDVVMSFLQTDVALLKCCQSLIQKFNILSQNINYVKRYFVRRVKKSA